MSLKKNEKEQNSPLHSDSLMVVQPQSLSSGSSAPEMTSWFINVPLELFRKSAANIQTWV